MTAETARINELRGDPGQLYVLLYSIAHNMLPQFLYKRGLKFSPEVRTEFEHESVLRLMERIQRRGDEYKIGHIRSVLWKEIKHQIDDKPRKKWEKSVITINDQVQTPENRPVNSDRHALAELLDDEDGRRVVLEIYFARTFSGLIRKLDTFKPRRWIYDNILAVESVYKNTRAMKCQERKRGHPTESRSISPLTRLLMRSYGPMSRIIQGRLSVMS
jgi:hypothetical protein